VMPCITGSANNDLFELTGSRRSRLGVMSIRPGGPTRYSGGWSWCSHRRVRRRRRWTCIVADWLVVVGSWNIVLPVTMGKRRSVLPVDRVNLCFAQSLVPRRDGVVATA
jgi:hypothetical protein